MRALLLSGCHYKKVLKTKNGAILVFWISVEFLEFNPPIDFNPPLLSEISNYSYSEMRQVRAPQAKFWAKSAQKRNIAQNLEFKPPLLSEPKWLIGGGG